MLTRYELGLDSLHRIQILCDENGVVLILIPEYGPLRLKLDNKVIDIEKARSINMENIKNVAKSKEEAQADVIESVTKYMFRGAVKAFDLGRFDIETLLSYPKSYFLKLDDATVAVKCEEVKNVLETHILILTNITAGNITEMEDALETYNDILYKPKHAREKRQTEGTEKLDTLFAEAVPLRTNMGRLFYSHLPAKTAAFDAANYIGKSLGRRSLSLVNHYTDKETGVALRNVRTTITNGVKTIVKYSTKLGYTRFYSLDADNWTMISEHETFDSDTKTSIGIDNKHIERFNIKLQKKPLSADPSPIPVPDATTGTLASSVFIKSTGLPQPNVQIMIPSLNYVSNTDENGEDHLDEIMPGTYLGIIYLAGYFSIPFQIVIVAGQTFEQKFYLISAAAPDDPTPVE